MIDLVYDRKTHLLLPENIDEINGQQLIGIAGVLHSKVNGLKARLKVMQLLSGRSLLNFYFLKNEIKLYSLDHVEWVFEDWSITNQLIPEYKGFYGPKAELQNLTLAEFYFSERYYADLLQNSTDEALDSLVSVLYRVPKPGYDKHKDLEGDIRSVFNNSAVDYYQTRIKRWPLKVKQAILLWYDGCRKKIADDNPEIFSGGGEEDTNNDADMFGILRSLAGGKYGDFEKVEKMFLHTALLEMNFVMKENERLKAEIQNN